MIGLCNFSFFRGIAIGISFLTSQCIYSFIHLLIIRLFQVNMLLFLFPSPGNQDAIRYQSLQQYVSVSWVVSLLLLWILFLIYCFNWIHVQLSFFLPLPFPSSTWVCFLSQLLWVQDLDSWHHYSLYFLLAYLFHHGWVLRFSGLENGL